jgi:hypothetical protein
MLNKQRQIQPLAIGRFGFPELLSLNQGRKCLPRINLITRILEKQVSRPRARDDNLPE